MLHLDIHRVFSNDWQSLVYLRMGSYAVDFPATTAEASEVIISRCSKELLSDSAAK